MIKRFIIFLFCLVYLLSLFPSTAIAADDIIEIRTTTELHNIQNNLAGHYRLMNDIVFPTADFSPSGAFYNGGDLWVPLGTGSTPFSGMLDGNGFAITGLKIFRPEENYIGLFSAVSGTVKDLKLKESDIYGYQNFGAVCGTLISGGLISNCMQSGIVEGNSNVGGIAGSCLNATIENCTNSGIVEGNFYVGGITSYVYSDSTIVNCTNSGNVSAYNRCGAGIVSQANDSVIQNCSNNGEISGNVRGSVGIGGVVGEALNAFITNCTNYGNVQGNGGIAGSVDGSLMQCVNYGQVREGCIGGRGGGIAGRVYGSSPSLMQCINYGQVGGSGIADYLDAGLIMQCANYANIKFESYLSAGIVGTSRGFIRECLNAGNLSAGATLGGIVGQMEGGLIRDCYNTGNLTHTHEGDPVGGIAGQITGSGRNIINATIQALSLKTRYQVIS